MPEAPISTGTLSRITSFSVDGGGFRRIALGVFDNELKLLPSSATLGVDFINGDLGTVRDVRSRRGKCARSGWIMPILMVCAATAPTMPMPRRQQPWPVPEKD